LRLFVGVETLLLPTMTLGGVGVVAMLPQVAGRLTIDLYDSILQGDLGRARHLQFKIFRLYDLFDVGSGYTCLKEAMNMIGRPGGLPRPPLLPYTEGQKDLIRRIIIDVGLLATPVH
jgi:4-hydroxy-tetrahydrodipicolinate synthase